MLGNRRRRRSFHTPSLAVLLFSQFTTTFFFFFFPFLLFFFYLFRFRQQNTIEVENRENIFLLFAAKDIYKQDDDGSGNER